MPEKDKQKKVDDVELSDATEKRIDHLPEHAQHIFKKVHANAVKHYQDPAKRSNCPISVKVIVKHSIAQESY